MMCKFRSCRVICLYNRIVLSLFDNLSFMFLYGFNSGSVVSLFGASRKPFFEVLALFSYKFNDWFERHRRIGIQRWVFSVQRSP